MGNTAEKSERNHQKSRYNDRKRSQQQNTRKGLNTESTKDSTEYIFQPSNHIG